MSTKKNISILLLLITAACSAAMAQPKVAVANLAFKETVKDFFYIEASSTRATEKSSASYAAAETYSAAAVAARAKSESTYSNDYVKAYGTVTKIERKELLTFTSEIKGNLIKSGQFRVQEAKPYTANNEQLFDVIKRIKSGYFPGAEYVLFGVINSLEWRNEGQPVPGTSGSIWNYGIDLGVEFSLINTKTLEVRAAFNAVGEGADNKVYTNNKPPSPNKARVMQMTSRSLAEETTTELMQQFGVKGLSSERTESRSKNSEINTAPIPTNPATVKQYSN
jgi:hypothetical protein